MEIQVSGEREQEQVRDLLRWLRHESLPGLTLDQKRAPTTPGAMGGELLPIVSALAASPIFVEIVKAIHGWLVARRPKVKVTVNLKEGVSFIIDAENLRDPNELVGKVQSAIQASGSTDIH